MSILQDYQNCTDQTLKSIYFCLFRMLQQNATDWGRGWGALYKQQTFHSSGGWKARIMVLADLGFGKGFLVHRQLSFSCVLTWQKRQGISEDAFMREIIPFMRVPYSCPSHLPVTPPPKASPLGLGFQQMNFEELKHADHSST